MWMEKTSLKFTCITLSSYQTEDLFRFILHIKEINIIINWKDCWKTSHYTQICALHCSEMYKDWPFCQNIILSYPSKKKRNPDGVKKIWTKTWSSCSHFRTYASWYTSKMSVVCLRIKKLINHTGFFPITSLGKTDVGPKEDDKTQGFLDPYQSAGTCVSTPYPGPS
jgi:hypothetical protein